MSSARDSLPLPRSRPCTVGFDARAIERLLDAVERSAIELHSLMVLRRGNVIAEGWWAPYSPGQRQLLYSVSKSVTSLAVGLAIADGLLTLDDVLVDLLDGTAANRVHDRFRQVTIRHALTMATGHVVDPLPHVLDICRERADPELLRGLFATPPEREPGTVFAYNQLATYSLARAVERSAGMPLIEYLGPRLFTPLGITEQAWMSWNGGNLGFSGLHLATESMAKIGQLLLQRGRWGDQQLLPADWVDQATAAQMPNDVAHRADPALDVGSESQLGYGFQFWKGSIGYRAAGAYGQLILVWPEYEMVVVTTATSMEAPLLELIAATLPAGVHDTGDRSLEDVDAQEQHIRDRLAGLALDAPADVARGCSGVFTRSETSTAAPELTEVTLIDRVGQRRLHASVSGQPLVVPLGAGRWLPGEWPVRFSDAAMAQVLHPRSCTRGDDPATTLPFFAAGGWRSDGTFETSVVLVSMAHTLQLLLHPDTGSFDVTWAAEPLRGPSPADHAVDA